MDITNNTYRTPSKDLSKLSQEDIKHLNRLTISNNFEEAINSLPTEKISRSDVLLLNWKKHLTRN
jgi:hypothetical protein